MEDLFTDLFTEYDPPRCTARDRLAHAWAIGAGLQAADGLKTSFFLRKTAAENIAGRISLEEANQRIAGHYAESPERDTGRSREADIMAARIAAILYQDPFGFSVPHFLSIHAKLFAGIYENAGKVRDHSISESEWVLNGDSVVYGEAGHLTERLAKAFGEEAEYRYFVSDIREDIAHLSAFVSELWQIHPFAEGNTRTIAVFLIRYLRFMGHPVMNTVFAENARYFRGALVRANYSDPARGIRPTAAPLELFLRNLIAGENNELNSDLLRV